MPVKELCSEGDFPLPNKSLGLNRLKSPNFCHILGSLGVKSFWGVFGVVVCVQ